MERHSIQKKTYFVKGSNMGDRLSYVYDVIDKASHTGFRTKFSDYQKSIFC